MARACSSFILSFLPGRPRNHTPEALDRLNPHSTRPPRIWHSVGECSFALGCLLQSLWPWFRAWGLRVCGLECTIEAGILTNITPHSSGLFFTNQKARDILSFIVPPRPHRAGRTAAGLTSNPSRIRNSGYLKTLNLQTYLKP